MRHTVYTLSERIYMLRYNGSYDMPSERGTYGAGCTVDFPHNQDGPWCETCYSKRNRPNTQRSEIRMLAEAIRSDSSEDRAPEPVWQKSTFTPPPPIKPQIRRTGL